MSTFYEDLRGAATNHERRALTGAVLEAMRLSPDDYAPYQAYYNLCATVIHGLGHEATRMSSRYAGEFPPVASAALVLTPQRVSGFLEAIHATPKPASAIEAGPGASAIFSVAAAARGAQVVAVEMNQAAAECAEEVVRLTGFAGQVQIRSGNVIGNVAGHADLAIAEILGPGLRGENGPAVIASLKPYATNIIPDAAVVYAADTGRELPYAALWQEIAAVDLTSSNNRVQGVFESAGMGQRNVYVRADICAGGREIVAGVGADDLTAPIVLGSVTVPHAGTPISVAYDIGPAPYALPDVVAIA